MLLADRELGQLEAKSRRTLQTFGQGSLEAGRQPAGKQTYSRGQQQQLADTLGEDQRLRGGDRGMGGPVGSAPSRSWAQLEDP